MSNMSPLFERIFVCYHGSIAGFENGCRPFLGFDGAHLKGPYGGILITIIGLDINLQFFLVTFAIVETENKNSWKWFLTQLKGPLANVLEM